MDPNFERDLEVMFDRLKRDPVLSDHAFAVLNLMLKLVEERRWKTMPKPEEPKKSSDVKTPSAKEAVEKSERKKKSRKKVRAKSVAGSELSQRTQRGGKK